MLSTAAFIKNQPGLVAFEITNKKIAKLATKQDSSFNYYLKALKIILNKILKYVDCL
jgi:hypothetical protein